MKACTMHIMLYYLYYIHFVSCSLNRFFNGLILLNHQGYDLPHFKSN